MSEPTPSKKNVDIRGTELPRVLRELRESRNLTKSELADKVDLSERAIRLVEMGVATPEDIDKGMRLGFGRAMGPFETNDLTGLDVSLNAALNVYNETHDPKFWPPALMFRKVKAGHLGRKTGRGWYEYTPDGKKKA